MRRQVMLYITGAAVIMVFAGSFIPSSWAREHLILFSIYWLLCAWLTITGILLALFDILLVRAGAKKIKRTLDDEYLKTQEDQKK